MKTCVLLVGLPASGKSTYVQKYFTEDSYIRVSSDDIIDEIADMVNSTYSEIFKDTIKYANECAERRFDFALNNGYDIVVDRTNLSPKSRKNWVSKAKAKGYKVEAHIMPLPNEDEHRRRLLSRPGKDIPWSVIENMITYYTVPSYIEGFDHISVYYG